MSEDIPILRKTDDTFIRQAYFGGATDYYKAYGKDLHYYDVNSLFPYQMCLPMPLNIINRYDDMSNINLDDFFGYAKS